MSSFSTRVLYLADDPVAPLIPNGPVDKLESIALKSILIGNRMEVKLYANGNILSNHSNCTTLLEASSRDLVLETVFNADETKVHIKESGHEYTGCWIHLHSSITDPFVYFAAVSPLKPDQFASRMVIRQLFEENTIALNRDPKLWHYRSKVPVSVSATQEQTMKVSFTGEKYNDGGYSKPISTISKLDCDDITFRQNQIESDVSNIRNGPVYIRANGNFMMYDKTGATVDLKEEFQWPAAKRYLYFTIRSKSTHIWTPIITCDILKRVLVHMLSIFFATERTIRSNAAIQICLLLFLVPPKYIMHSMQRLAVSTNGT